MTNRIDEMDARTIDEYARGAVANGFTSHFASFGELDRSKLAPFEYMLSEPKDILAEWNAAIDKYVTEAGA
jgi:hypothetical protein